MTGSDPIDLSLANIWRSWQKFRQGKKPSTEIENFSYRLENNLFEIFCELNSNTYSHSGYRTFVLSDNKRRVVSVARIKDRVVHRLVYDYLLEISDRCFDFDAWSCRKNKGLLAAIERAQGKLNKNKNSFVWRADVRKFFDSINQDKLTGLIQKKINDSNSLLIIQEIIGSFQSGSARKRIQTFGRGMPIGNLTSQVFANIYLDELDFYVRNSIKPVAYVRYGDDFLIFERNLDKLKRIREDVYRFLQDSLFLEINNNNDIIVKAKYGIKYLGVKMYPNGRKLLKRNISRAFQLADVKNCSSYHSLVKNHQSQKLREFDWNLLEKINYE